MKRVIFVTGTDTGVGKTLVTSLLLAFLRHSGFSALAMKPFCTGDRQDVERLQLLQKGVLSNDAINPFFFPWPLSPSVAARRAGRRVSITQVLRAIRRVKQRCDILLVEGAGGLLSPLGTGFFTAEDLIAALRCEVIVVARNRLGALNQTALVMRALRQNPKAGPAQVVLNGSESTDESATSNATVLRRWLCPTQISEIPFLRGFRGDFEDVRGSVKKLKKVLATILH